jgi:hypothetical protein
MLQARAGTGARARRLSAELSLGALGVTLVLLVSLAWASGLVYLVARLGLPAPVNLALTDAVHIYVGLASVVVISAKVWRVGFSSKVAGVPELVAWHRWVSWSLLVLYGGVYLSGVLLLFSFAMTVRTTLVNAHLLASVWAAVPTTWHVWHYRQRATALLPGLGRWRQTRRVWAGLVLVLAPTVLIGANPRALSPLTQLGGGGHWIDDGLSGVFVDRLALAPDGKTLVAGGRGLWINGGSGRPWQQVAPPDALVLGLTTAPSSAPGAIYVGTSKGLLVAAEAEGPYTPLSFPSGEVHGITVDPTGRVIWASSRAGVFRSIDGGATWSPEVRGMRSPRSSWAVAYFEGTVYASDESSVYKWDGQRWRRSSDQVAVASLDADPATHLLYASSMGEGVWALDAGGAWRVADSGLAAHGTSGAIHVASVTPAHGSRTYASLMLGGVATSLDRGQSWGGTTATVLRGGAWRTIQVGSQLYLATGLGILRYELPEASPAGLDWWVVVIVLATVATGLGLWIGAVEPRPRGDRHTRQTSHAA